MYYLDGIEVLVINHFQTQGASGGPAGILNVSFIEDVTLSTSAFNARYDNALGGVLQFRQRDGNPDRVQGNVRLSATEPSGTLEGPLAKNTTFLASVRRFYLQLLAKAIGSPIRPNYWDSQFKITTKLGPKTTLTALGLGAIDHFEVAEPRESTPENTCDVRSTSTVDQWNYTVGVSLRQLLNRGYLNLALSRTQLNNEVNLFEGGLEFKGDESRRVLLTRSGEVENKLRLDVNRSLGKWQYAYGAVGQSIQYDSRYFSRLRQALLNPDGSVQQPAVNVPFQSDLQFIRFGAFAQVTRPFLTDDRLGGGAPYTPFDAAASQRNYLTIGQGVLDYSRLNTERLNTFQQLDLRFDKIINRRRLTFDLFLDVQNVLAFKTPAAPSYTFQRTPDNSAFATTDGQAVRPDGSNAVPFLLDNNRVLLLPTIGFIVEF